MADKAVSNRWPVGTRVVVTRGGHRGEKASVVECPDLQLGLVMGGQSCGTSTSLRDLGQGSHLVWIEFDDVSILGGKWGTGVFEYDKGKLRVICVLDEIVEATDTGV